MRTTVAIGAFLALALLAVSAGSALAAEELNLYSARHYKTDEALYRNFTEQTGIKINRIEGKGDALLARIQSEGANSPADVLLTVDVGRLYRADQAGLFQAVESEVLVTAIPASLRHPENHWFGFSTRARMIFYDKAKVKPGEITTYEDLADPKWKGRICIRESSNIYNQSLLGSMIAVHGEAGAEAWAQNVVGNFARPPVKGDTNQLRGILSGECEVAVANSYYFVRLLTAEKEAEAGWREKVGWVFPNQGGRGAHVNISGAGVLKTAPHPEAAVKFLEYLASPEAQTYLAEGNNEYPVVNGAVVAPALAELGDFKADQQNVVAFGANQAAAQRIFDRVGWR